MKPPWTDDTVMPWGKHQGKKLIDIPASYLLWLFEQPWIKDWPELHAYLKEAEDTLLQEKSELQANEEEMLGEVQGFESFDDYLKDYRGF